MDQYSQDFSMLPNFNVNSSNGSVPSFSIPGISSQSSAFNQYNPSDYVHVSQIQEIVIKSFESVVERVVERVVEKHIDRVLVALKENPSAPVSLNRSTMCK